MNKLLSIIVPTKDRYEYLEPLINLLCSFNFDNFEIVIQDNSVDNKQIVDFLDQNKDERVKYFHNIKPLSVIQNCDFAVSNSSGQYICFIGDDDGVLEWVFDCCNWMTKNSIDAVYFNKAHYIWPDLSGKYSVSSSPATLKIPVISNKVTKVSPKNQLEKVLKVGGIEMKQLPRLYHGIILKEALEEVFETTNSYFPGPSPDMANAVALTRVLKNAYYVDFPIVITGSGVKSTSGQGAKHEHKGSLENKSFLPKDTAKNWSEHIPKFWSGPTIWSESLIKSASRSNIDLGQKLNYAYLYSACFTFTPEYDKVIKESIKKYCNKNGKNKTLFMLKVNLSKIIIFSKRAKSLITNILYKYNVLGFKENKYSSVMTINEAAALLTKKFKDDSNLFFHQ